MYIIRIIIINYSHNYKLKFRRQLVWKPSPFQTTWPEQLIQVISLMVYQDLFLSQSHEKMMQRPKLEKKLSCPHVRRPVYLIPLSIPLQ